MTVADHHAIKSRLCAAATGHLAITVLEAQKQQLESEVQTLKTLNELVVTMHEYRQLLARQDSVEQALEILSSNFVSTHDTIQTLLQTQAFLRNNAGTMRKPCTFLYKDSDCYRTRAWLSANMDTSIHNLKGVNDKIKTHVTQLQSDLEQERIAQATRCERWKADQAERERYLAAVRRQVINERAC